MLKKKTRFEQIEILINSRKTFQSMDYQFGAAVILILLGLGLTQIDGGKNEFILGAAWGIVAVGCMWVGIRVMKEYKKR